MNRNLFIYTILLLIFPLVATAQKTEFTPISADQRTNFVAKIKETAKSTTRLNCNFIQQKHISVLTEVSESKGLMTYSFPSNLRWEYISPEPFAFIIEDGKSRIENGTGEIEMPEQAKRMVASLSNMIMSMVNGSAFDNSKNYDMKFFSNGNQTMIELSPKSAKIKRAFSLIKVIIDNRTYLSSSVEMVEKGGDKTVIKFTNIEFQH